MEDHQPPLLGLGQFQFRGHHYQFVIADGFHRFRLGGFPGEGGGLSAVAGGISEALFATAVGLLVAIPAVMLYNAYNARVESFGIDMNDVASELIDFVLKEGRY